MQHQLLRILEDVSGGKCYNSLRYSYDNHDLPLNEYDDRPREPLGQSGERERHKKSINLKKRSSEFIETAPIFKYFLDGSRRTYKIDDIAIDNSVYPILIGQIGVGCCERVNPDKFKPALTLNFLNLCVPDILDKDGKQDLFFNNLTQKINDIPFLRKHSLRINKILPYSISKLTENENFVNRGISRIQDEMIEQEKQSVKSLADQNLLTPESCLIKDGSLEYSEKGLHNKHDLRLNQIKNNYRFVVGVSKSFSPDNFKNEKNGNTAAKVAELPLMHRTPAYMYETQYIPDVRFCIWYLRIREAKHTTNQFDGILKIEKIMIHDAEYEYGLSSEEIDLISCNIINERNPVAHGTDKRWANHLYPIYLTESFIKSRYLSDNYLLNIF